MVHIVYSPKSSHKSVRNVLPMMVNWHRFINWRYLYVLNLIFVFEKFRDFWVLFSHFFKFFLSDRASLFSVKDLQDIFLWDKLFIDPWSLWLDNIFRSCYFQYLILLLRMISSSFNQCLFHLHSVMTYGKPDKSHSSLVYDFKITLVGY